MGISKRWRLLTHVLLMLCVMLGNVAVGGANSFPRYEWQQVGPFDGGVVLSAEVDQTLPSVVYVGTDGNGVYKSTDGGATWNPASQGIAGLSVYAVKIDPGNHSTIYAGTNGGIFRSGDAGTTWRSVSTGINSQFVFSLSIRGGSIFAATGNGAYRSSNAGETWLPFTGLAEKVVQSIAPADDSLLYAATTNGLFRSSDGGNNWSQVTGLPASNIQAVAVNPSNPLIAYLGTWGGGVVKTYDGGVTWASANSGINDPYIRTLAINPLLPDTVYAGTYSGIFRTTTGGNNWTIPSTLFRNIPVYGIAVAPVSPATLYLGTSSGVYKSTDNGANWSKKNTGISSVSARSLAIDPVSPSTIYAGANSGVFKSTTRGTLWNSANTGLGSLNIRKLAINPTSPATVYAATDAGIFRSLDRGATWAASNSGLTSLDISTIATHPSIGSIMYAGTRNGLFKSTDGGITWNASSTGLSPLKVSALAVDPDTPEILYAAVEGGAIFKSTDSGATWNSGSTGITDPFINTLAASAGIVVAGTNGGLFRSTDGGVTWNRATSIDNPYVYSLMFDRTSPASLYAGTDGGVFRSADGGISWTPINAGLSDLRVRSLALDTTTRTLFAGTFGTGVFRLPAIDVTLSPAPFSFGNVAVHTSSSPQQFVLSNTADYTVRVNGISLIGLDTSMYQLSLGTCPNLSPVLQGGESCTFTVTYIPRELGIKTAKIRITSDSLNYPMIETDLTGTGVIQAYTLSLTSTGTGTGTVNLSSGDSCAGNCSQSFPSGTTVTLTALADADSVFSGWSGCDSMNGNVCTILINGPKTAQVAFEAVLHISPLYPWVSAGLDGVAAKCITADPTNPAIIYAGTANGVHKSTNGGNSWSSSGLADFAIRALAVNPLSTSEIFAATPSGVFRSTDNGANWTAVNIGLDNQDVYALAIDPVTPSTIYAGTNGGAFKSTSSGDAWMAVSSGLGIRIRSLAIDPKMPTTLYAGVADVASGVYKSTDGAATWTLRLAEGKFRANSVVVDPVLSSNIYAGGTSENPSVSGTIHRSTDGGTTWTGSFSQPDTWVGSLAIDPTTPSVIYAGTGNGALVSHDSGATWENINTGLLNTSVNAVTISRTSPPTAYAATEGGIFRVTYAQVSVTPESRNFGRVATGRVSTSERFTLENTGTAPLIVSSITVSGPDSEEFSLSADSCTSLAPTLLPGQNCSVLISLNAATVGDKIATLRISSNAPAAVVKLVPLSGSAYDPPPVGTISINGGATITNSTSVTLTLFALDNSGPVPEMRFSNNNSYWSAWEPYATSKSWTLTTGDDTKYVYVQFRDSAGNVSDGFWSSIVLNSRAPVTTITSMPVPWYTSPAGTFSFIADESGSTFQCSINAGAFLPCTSPFAFSGLSDGSHTFSVRATNAAGITEITPVTYSWTIDTIRPDTAITSGPPSFSYAAPATFTFTATEAGSTFECSIDNGSFTPCPNPHVIASLKAGSHTLSVRALDRAGNVDPTPESYTWTVRSPNTMLTSTPTNPSTFSSGSFSFISDASGATFECSLDSGAFAACTSPYTFDNLSSGSHTFSVRAKDSAGGYDPNPPRFSWAITSGPVKVVYPGGSSNFFPNLGSATASVPAGTSADIYAQAAAFSENLVIGNNATLSLTGGYDTTFGNVVGTTTVSGSLTVADGTLVAANLVIQ
ncbi:choice-of-anchor D domain-containing protein [Geobacter sp. DSM 9736]|uniref:choice-of-anchor D domain-containing protein n=1 Tax=Geobacter sp. DSM 9736 TaxID=1277350 RepID=UPI000B50DAD6|nr:choice-of-anchor D domain-containing protein [Geobacter sp. DSM 9736]SNB48096.1 Uncharacterized protein SAMN06269301_3592 [Geobacter sp. DSM 9736]